MQVAVEETAWQDNGTRSVRCRGAVAAWARQDAQRAKDVAPSSHCSVPLRSCDRAIGAAWYPQARGVHEIKARIQEARRGTR